MRRFRGHGRRSVKHSYFDGLAVKVSDTGKKPQLLANGFATHSSHPNKLARSFPVIKKVSPRRGGGLGESSLAVQAVKVLGLYSPHALNQMRHRGLGFEDCPGHFAVRPMTLTHAVAQTSSLQYFVVVPF